MADYEAAKIAGVLRGTLNKGLFDLSAKATVINSTLSAKAEVVEGRKKVVEKDIDLLLVIENLVGTHRMVDLMKP